LYLEQHAVRFGLAAVKNVGVQAMESIIQERGEAPFDSLLDFCRRVDLRVCNKRVIESLILCGAMDTMPGHRAQLLAMLDEAVEAAMKWKKERDDLQLHLFGFVEETHWTIPYPEIRTFTMEQNLIHEKELLGLYLSGHPLDTWENKLEELGANPIRQLPDLQDGENVMTAGMVVSTRIIMTKKGQPMAFLELEDRVSKVEAVIFPELWKTCENLAVKGKLLAVRGKLQVQDEEVKIIVDQACAIEQLRTAQWQRKPVKTLNSGKHNQQTTDQKVHSNQHQANKAKIDQKLYIKISISFEQKDRLEELKIILQAYHGPIHVHLFYEKEQQVRALNHKYTIKPSPELLSKIEDLMGKGSAIIK
jgi:DNA polymerase-3 subunit alpha